MSEPIIIINIGLRNIKACLSTHDIPITIFPNLIGHTIHECAEKIGDIKLKPIMIGDEEVPLRPYLEVSSPMTDENFENPEDLAILWVMGLLHQKKIRNKFLFKR